jgi:hypothetical protein
LGYLILHAPDRREGDPTVQHDPPDHVGRVVSITAQRGQHREGFPSPRHPRRPDLHQRAHLHLSTRIPVVCSSVQEAEWAGTFSAARTAITERQTLSDLWYPQPPTLLHCDNEVAVGIANKAVKAKLSKACDMRLHWLIDRC